MLCVLSFTPLAPFLWVVNVSVTKFVSCMLPSMDVVTKTLWLKLKALSLSCKGVLSDLYTMYSPVRSRKK